MSRTLFTVPLGIILSCVCILPLTVHASTVDEGPDDAPQGKIVGQGTRSHSYSTPSPASAYNSSYYGTTGYPAYGTTGPASAYNTSYYGTTGYPAMSYNSYYASPNTLYNSSYYGTTGYPATAYNAYYNNYGYPSALNDPYYGNSSLNEPYFGMYGTPNSSYDSYYGTYNYPAYSPSYSPYQNPYGYRYPGYRPYYPTGNMYNANTKFVNPPSSLNYPRYPVYSETYINR